MDFYTVERDGGELVVGQTLTGRLTEAAVRFVVWAPLTMFGLSVVFMSDYLCEYREQEPVPGMFWAVLGATALFIAGVAGFVRFSRRDAWLFDVRGGEVVFQAHPLVGRSVEAAVDLSKLEGITVRSVPFPRVSGVAISIEGRPDEIVCSSRFGWSTVSNVAEALETFVDDHGLQVEIEEEQ